MVLGCQALSKSFRGQRVLDGCELDVRAGECVIIRGRSGGGKSTLLRCLSLLVSPDSGRVIHDRTVHAFPAPPSSNGGPPVVYPFLTLVFQQLYLWPNLTVEENLAIVIRGNRRSRLPDAADALLTRLDVAGVLHKRPAQCSLGQRQRIAVARAVLSDARFVLLDEPTSALDRRNRAEMVAILGDVKQRGRGLLVVSHDERDFESIADRTFELDGGHLSRL